MGKIWDISHHQISSAINWGQAAKELSLLLIRVQYGSTTIDREYKNHVANAKKYNIPFGHYAYGLFTSVADAKKEAQDFISRIDKAAKFVALDVEKDTVKSCGTANLAAASQAFIDVCKAAGYKTGFYVSHELYRQYGLDRVKADFLWLPRYGKDNGQPDIKPDYPCDLWQYSQKCQVAGFAGGADLNLLNGSKSLDWFTGAVKNGWKLENEKWYFYENGSKKTGWVKDKEIWYYLDSNGVMVTGWLQDGSKWYYLNPKGDMRVGWLLDKDKWYYLGSDGAMKTGWLRDKNKWYYLNADGSMATGKVTVNGKEYQLRPDGSMVLTNGSGAIVE